MTVWFCFFTLNFPYSWLNLDLTSFPSPESEITLDEQVRLIQNYLVKLLLQDQGRLLQQSCSFRSWIEDQRRTSQWRTSKCEQDALNPQTVFKKNGRGRQMWTWNHRSSSSSRFNLSKTRCSWLVLSASRQLRDEQVLVKWRKWESRQVVFLLEWVRLHPLIIPV